MVNGFIFRDDDGQVTLIDMGVKSSGPKVMAALSAIGSGPGDVTRLLLTHAHPDKAGGEADDAEFARSGQSPPSDPSLRLGALVNRLMGGRQDFEPLEVAETFVDGQVVP